MEENKINALMSKANLQRKESWVTLYLHNGKEIFGQILDYDKDKVLIYDGEIDVDEDVLVIPVNIIHYFACGGNYFGFEDEE